MSDVNLVAAAPDLLEALEEARGALRGYLYGGSDFAGEAKRVLPLIDKAIAKAKGEQGR